MEPTDLTVHILREIRDEVRGVKEEQRFTREEVKAEIRALAEKTDRRFEQMEARFEVIETTLRDLAQQFVVLGRAVKVAMEHRTASTVQLEDLERRVAELEKRQPG